MRLGSLHHRLRRLLLNDPIRLPIRDPWGFGLRDLKLRGLSLVEGRTLPLQGSPLRGSRGA